jgi:hypothetical protein
MDQPTVKNVEEILAEEHDLRTALDHANDLTDAATSWPRLRGDASNPPVEIDSWLAAGRLLSQETWLLLAELDWLEVNLPASFPRTNLVVRGCQVVEHELVRLVGQPCRRIGAALVQATQDRLSPDQTHILERWHTEERFPLTLGTVEMILYALRSGHEQALPEIEVFLKMATEAVVLYPDSRPEGSFVADTILQLPTSASSPFQLEGPPGTETLLAIATRESLPLPLPPGGQASLPILGTEELAKLADILKEMDSEAWAVGWCRFEVGA